MKPLSCVKLEAACDIDCLSKMVCKCFLEIPQNLWPSCLPHIPGDTRVLSSSCWSVVMEGCPVTRKCMLLFPCLVSTLEYCFGMLCHAPAVLWCGFVSGWVSGSQTLCDSCHLWRQPESHAKPDTPIEAVLTPSCIGTVLTPGCLHKNCINPKLLP